MPICEWSARTVAGVLCMSFVLAGCASFSRDGGFDTVASGAKERGLDQEIKWLRDGEDPTEIRAMVTSLLKKPLTPDAAVQIALLNNQSLQATYAELGIAPSWPLGGKGVTVGIPVKMGFSLSDYYEANGEDNGFGYFDLGVLFTVPFSSAPTKFGTWNLHGGVDFFALGDGTKYFNVKDGTPEGSQVIGSIGIGLSY